ncbi:hypothetical protein DPMN_183670 [Dreissena polymorpha]|uniref:Uncharacterized protein n=1 Tax=Dreissena polymorpha TaxID=45954 RepID=A0A9D4DKD2_DREPO|nr:hypothetical protein DPMN_183670 [Dreissena polymorpha]
MSNKSKNNNNKNINMSENSVKTNGSGDSIVSNDYRWVAEFLAGPGGYLEKRKWSATGSRTARPPRTTHGRVPTTRCRTIRSRAAGFSN